jgi:hypothetical protein
MTKDKLSQALQASPVKSVHRTNIAGREIFIADGFVPPGYLQFLERFNMTATKEEFPLGCFATIWYSEVRTGGECGIMLCDAFHDPGHSKEAKQEMRIKKVILMAADDIAAREKTKRIMH